jgi:hypothetical protein
VNSEKTEVPAPLPSVEVFRGKLPILRVPGKGGWSHVLIPATGKDLRLSGGWVKLSGSVDEVPYSDASVFFTKEKTFFFPLKADLRKQIGKGEGDIVAVVASLPLPPLSMRDELLESLHAVSNDVLQRFLALDAKIQAAHVAWVDEPVQIEGKVNRILKLVKQLELE